jgi:hypothetical protein
VKPCIQFVRHMRVLCRSPAGRNRLQQGPGDALVGGMWAASGENAMQWQLL